MLLVTNNQEQTLQPGQAATFPVVVRGSKCNSQPRLTNPGNYTITFNGNIGATSPGEAALAISVGDVIQPTTTMKVATATAGDLSNVSATCPVRITCCNVGTGTNLVTIVNDGDTPCTLGANPSLMIEGE